jgi:Tol biopolymer transport system component
MVLEKQLTPEDLISNFPTYSPDGKKIAFRGDSLESANIFTMNADGSDITKITSDLVELENCFGNCVISDWGAEPVE